MAIFGKERTFEEITGMSEEDFRARAEELKTLKDREAARDAETAEMKTQLEQTKAALQALQNPEPAPNSNDPKKPTGFYEDPDKAFAERIAPTALHTLNLAARVEALTAREKFSKEYTLWGAEIDDMIAKHQNVADKGNPDFYKNVVDIVKGRHLSDILEAERKGQSLFTEGASGAHVGSSSESNFNLSSDQINAAKRLGMTPKEFSDNYNAIAEARGVRVGNA